MYKTVWLINDEKSKKLASYYHFGKEPKFPSWYMKKETVYEIEMMWNLKLVFTLKIFFKCLFQQWIIR